MRSYIFVALLLSAVWISAVVADIDQTVITPDLYYTLGSGEVTSEYIRLTNATVADASIILYNIPQTVGYGFEAEINYTSLDCSVEGGADGFTLIFSPTLIPDNVTLAPGFSLAVEGLTNVALVAIAVYGNRVRVCSTNDVPLSWNACQMLNLNVDLECNGAHKFKIAFTPPGDLKVLIDDGSTYNFTHNFFNFTEFEGQPMYVGFSGSTGGVYMAQRITAWTLTTTKISCEVSNGGCSDNASCEVVSDTIQCTCNDGFTGNGYTCTAPPVEQPVNDASPVVPLAAPVNDASPVVPLATPVDASPAKTPAVSNANVASISYLAATLLIALFTL